MIIGLYTSRIVLSALGNDDFGVYSVVGGVVAMFSILSASLSSAISRFITIELGKGTEGDLKSVFSASITIQICLAVIIAILAEPIGLWFIHNKMELGETSIKAAEWVLHFSVITFIINLLSIPYNAAIIAYEKMGAFAYISIFEGICKLGIAFAIVHCGEHRLEVYAALMCALAIIIRLTYGIYCKKKLNGCTYTFKWNRLILKDMFSFAGWNTIGTMSGVCRDQGVNILLNVFGNPAINAAKAIAFQINGIAHNFVTSFMTALNPQITKSYISGEREYMFKLINNGARFSYYILLFICIPLIIEADYILRLWLVDVPEYTTGLVQWTLAFVMSESISSPLITAMLATGKIRNYQIIVGGLQLMNLPVSYLLLKMGLSPISVMITAFVISQICLFARLVMLRQMIGLDVGRYLKHVYLNIISVTIAAFIPSYLISTILSESILSLIGFFLFTTGMVVMSIAILGCSKEERNMIWRKTTGIFKKEAQDD